MKSAMIKLKLLVTIALCASLMLPSAAFAVSAQRRALEQHPLYDPTAEIAQTSAECINTLAAGGGQIAGQNISLAGSTNEEKAYNFFLSKTLPDGRKFQPFHSAGIVGNISWESSGVNPNIKQFGGGPGRGIVQWEVGGRWDELLAWAKKNPADPNDDLNPYDLGVQLEYVWLEGTTKSIYKNTMVSVANETTVEGATQTFERIYERAGKPKMAERIKIAIRILNTFGNGAPAAVGPAAGGSSDTQTPCDPDASATSSITGDHSALVNRLLGNSLVTTDDSTIAEDLRRGGQCKGGQVERVNISDDLIRLLISLVETTKTTVRLSSVVSNHDCLSDGGGISNHSGGFAADIGNEEQADTLYPYLYANRGQLKIDELIYSKDGSQNSLTVNGKVVGSNLKGGIDHVYGSATTKAHDNHIHVSVKKGS